MFAPAALLDKLFRVAVAAADPAVCMPPLLPPPPTGRTIVVGCVKAAAAMAAAVERNWDAPIEGLVVTRYGHGVTLRRIALCEAAHPHSDEASRNAATDMLARVAGLTRDDLVIALVSGGSSALLSLPAPGLSAADKALVLARLLHCGAPIRDINIVRRRLSANKGGRLAAAAYPAHVHSIVVSDVPGDDPALVASGPTFADTASPGTASDILNSWRILLPEAVLNFLNQPPVPLGPSITTFAIAATAQTALEAARAAAVTADIHCRILSDRIECESRIVGAEHAAFARAQLPNRPLLLLSGGETSVTVRGKGQGGRNTEYLLAFAQGIEGLPIAALAADTDGIDGSGDNAGAYADGTTATRARKAGLDLTAYLADNKAYAVFNALGDLIMTGPSRTNVNDFRAMLVGVTP